MSKLQQFLVALIASLLIAILYVLLTSREAAAHESNCPVKKVSTSGWNVGVEPATADLLRQIDRERWLRCLATVRPRPKPEAPEKRS